MYIRRDVAEAISAHSRRQSPRECCGLLIGSALEVIEVVATANVAAEPHLHYQASPVAHFAQIRRCCDAALQGAAFKIIGAYHSHPRSSPGPSPTDLEEVFSDFLHIIAGSGDGSVVFALRAYWLRVGKFETVELTIVGRV